MATFYIDPTAAGAGTGTIGDPFQSWASVTWAAGNSYLQKCGTTFLGGVTVGASGTVGNPITIGKYVAVSAGVINPGDNPKITNTSGVGLTSAGRDYVNISDITATGCSSDGMNLRGSNCNFTDLLSYSNTAKGINFNLAVSWSNTVFTRCVSRDNGTEAIGSITTSGAATISDISFIDCKGMNSGGSLKSGLYMEISAGSTTVLSNITVTGGEYSGNSGGGINIRDFVDTFPGPSSRTIDGLQISGVILKNNGSCGVSVVGASSTVRESFIEKCIVSGNGALQTLGGIWFARSNGMKVRYNSSSNNTTLQDPETGIDGAGIFDDQYNVDCQVYNNLVWGNLGSTVELSGAGIYVYNTVRSRHWGNVIWGNKKGYIVGHQGTVDLQISHTLSMDNTDSNYYMDSTCPDLEMSLRNSISYLSPIGIHSQLGSRSMIEEYNIVYGSTTNYSGLTADTSDTQANPNLMSNSKPYFGIKSDSRCVARGKVLSDSITDIYGKSYAARPNIGPFATTTFNKLLLVPNFDL